MAGNSPARATDPIRLERIMAIVLRYPHIAEAERAEVLLFLDHAPTSDKAILAELPEIQSKLAAFRTGCDARFERRRAIFAAMMAVLFVAFCVFLWVAAR
jgi:AcrR family transcriptional regulator